MEAILEKTIQQIESGIKDIQANKATKSEVLELIDQRVKTDREKLAQVESQSNELKAVSNDFSAQIRRMGAVTRSAARTSAGLSGPFANWQDAKAFALTVIAGTLANTKHQAKADAAVKSLKEMGIDPIWLDSEGRKTMTGSSMTGGGALVSSEQVASWITLLETYGVLRRNATVMPMGAAQTTMPKLDTLLTGYVPGEGGTITAGDPKIAVINLVPKTLNFMTAYSLELEDDSMVALGQLLGGLFARSAAYAEDLCGFLGDGTSTYFGFKGLVGTLRAVDATISNIKGLVVGTGNAYSELVIGDFEKVPGILPNYADDGDAKWYMHRYFYWTVMVKLALASGAANATEILLGAGTRQKQFFGYPVEFTSVMPRAEANSQICALFGNLRLGCILGTRGGFEIAQSTERYFESGLVAVRGRDRVAINAHGVGNTTDAGPIVGLITAAA